MKVYKDEIMLALASIAIIGGLILGGYEVQKSKQGVANIITPPETDIGVGDELYLQAQASVPKGTVSYIWYKDGVPLAGEYQGAAHILIEEFGKDDAGLYTVAPVVSEGKLELVCAQSEPMAIRAHIHSGGNATCTEKAKCEVCGKEYGEKEEHHGGEATCIERAVCIECGQPYGDVDKTNHVEGAQTEQVRYESATCTKDGYTGDTVCVECGGILEKGEAIPATGHSFETEVTDLKCSICGERNPEFKDPTYTKDAIPNPAYGLDYATLVYPNLGISNNVIWGDDELMLGTANTVCQFVGSSVFGSKGSHMLHTNGGALAKLGDAKKNDDIIIKVGNYMYAYKVDSINVGTPTADAGIITDAAGTNLVSTSNDVDELYLYAPTDATSGTVTVVHAKISSGALIVSDTKESASKNAEEDKTASSGTANQAQNAVKAPAEGEDTQNGNT